MFGEYIKVKNFVPRLPHYYSHADHHFIITLYKLTHRTYTLIIYHWKEEFYPDSRVIKTGSGCISLKREIIILSKILRKYMSYNFWVAPLEFQFPQRDEIIVFEKFCIHY
jgi:hypothetical protein